MSNENRGKQFEDQIRSALEKDPAVAVDRLIDPQNGFAGVRNRCDFIAYKYPHVYYLECKSCHGPRLSISSNNPKHKYGAITNNQWEGLLEHSKVPGVVAGYMIWFIDYDLTMFVSAQFMEKWRATHKSFAGIKFDEKLSKDVFVIDGKKKRVLFDYDLTSFFEWSNSTDKYD